MTYNPTNIEKENTYASIRHTMETLLGERQRVARQINLGQITAEAGNKVIAGIDASVAALDASVNPAPAASDEGEEDSDDVKAAKALVAEAEAAKAKDGE